MVKIKRKSMIEMGKNLFNLEGNVIIVTGLVTIQRTAEISIVIKELDEMVIFNLIAGH